MRLPLPKFTKPYHIRDYKFNLVILVMALSVIGVLAVGSAKAVNQPKQMFGVATGVVIMVIVSLIDYIWIADFYWLIYLFSVAILGAVLLFGDNVNGATRWIDLGFTTFQPSELAKILLIIFFSKFITENKDDINDAVTLVKYAVLCNSYTDGCYLPEHCRTAQSGHIERLSAGSYSCFSGTGKICKRRRLSTEEFCYGDRFRAADRERPE